MRALIFILTLLIGFQPAAWAMGNHVPSTAGKSLQAMPGLDTQSISSTSSATQLRDAPTAHFSETSHHRCLDMAGLTTDSTATNCLSDCPGSCTSSLFLERPPIKHDQGNASFIANQAPTLSSFVSLTGPPEIHPPRAGIQLV